MDQRQKCMHGQKTDKKNKEKRTKTGVKRYTHRGVNPEGYKDRYGYAETLDVKYKELHTLTIVEKKAVVNVIRTNVSRGKIRVIKRNVYIENNKPEKEYVPYMNLNRPLYRDQKHGNYIIIDD